MMVRPLLPACLAMALAFPALAEQAPTTATAQVDLQQPARIRLFSANGQYLAMRKNHTRSGAEAEVVRVESKASKGVFSTLASLATGNESTSIGMPESFATGTLGGIRKPFYREFALVPGQLVNVMANFEGNRRCVPAGERVRDLRFTLPPSLLLTPEPGLDYEVSFGTDGSSCGMNARLLLADGRSVPLPTELQRQRSAKTYKVEGTHLYTFLFRPGSVYYRPVGEAEDLQLRVDDAEHADAFETAMREIASRPGTQMCILLPDFFYKSPLKDRLDRVLDEQDKNFPAILEPIEGLRKVRQLEDHVPTTFLDAAAYCQLAGMMAFPPRNTLDGAPDVAAPAQSNNP